ncbi:retention module-containing protein [Parazoarcus communis]|nr:retention module-containing protein [Parazoarcus communis]
MASAKAVATVVSITGKAEARDQAGNLRLLKVGDALLEGETLVTAAGARAELLVVADGSIVPVGEDQAVLISADLSEATRPQANEAQLADGTIQQVIQALNDGANLDDVLEEPAAGLTGGGGGDGNDFVRLLRITEGVDPIEFEFEGSAAAVVPELRAAGDGADEAQTVTTTGETETPVTVTPVNDAPETNAVAATGEEDAASIPVSLSGSDADGTVDHFVIKTLPLNGTLLLNGNPVAVGTEIPATANGATVTFVPAANWNGETNFTYASVDDLGLEDGTPATATVTVSPVNDAPDTAATSASGAEDAAAIPVSLSGSDPDGTVDHFVIKTLPLNGTLLLNGNPVAVGTEIPATGNGATVTFVPSANWNGETNFTYASVDDLGLEDGTPATATVTVSPVNDAPDTAATSASGAEDAAAIPVRLSGSDPDGTVDHFVIKTLPLNGTLLLNGNPVAVGTEIPATANGATVTFVPAANWNGETNFTYASVDDLGLEDGTPATATVTVSAVNDAPETAATSASGEEDAAAIPVSLSGSDPDGTVDHFVIKTLPLNGTLLLNGNPVAVGTEIPATGNGATVTFVPSANWNGETNFTYASVDDLGLEDGTPATATVTVSPVNDAPDTAATSASGAEDAASIPVSLSGSDVDGTVDHFVIKTLPLNGTLLLNGNPVAVGTEIPATANGATVTFVPAANWNGETNFTYASVDDLGLEDGTPATATVTVSPVNDAPDTAATSASGAEDAAAIPVSLSGSDPDGTVDHFVIKTLPLNGTLLLNGNPVAVGTEIPATGNGATVTFVPSANWNGETNFTYASVDDLGLEDGTPATATVTVSPVNDAPDTAATSASGAEDAAAIPVRLSGSDPDGTVDHFVIKTLPLNGTLLLNGNPVAVGTEIPATANGATVTFVPAANWNGETNFTYASVDDLGLEDGTPATATVTVSAVNDAPETAATSASGEEDAAAIPVSLSGSDPDGTVDHFVIKTLPLNGTLLLNGNPVAVGTEIPATGNGATVTFVPSANWNGETNFTYASVDDLGLEDGTPATATVTVSPVNDAPDTAATSASGAEDAASIPVSLSGSDVDGTVDHFVIKTLPLNGTLLLNGNPVAVGTEIPATANGATVTFVPAANWNGETNFTYASVDSDGLEDPTPAIAAISVTPDSLIVTHLEATTTGVPVAMQGLSGEYYGYNDNSTSASDGFSGVTRVHTNDGTVGNLTTIAKVQQIIAGRAAPDASFKANSIEFGLTENTNSPLFSNDLGRNAKIEAGGAITNNGSNLYRFLTGANAGNAQDIVAVSGVGKTTDSIIRLTGQLLIEQGTYDIRITADDGYDVLLNGTSIAEYNGITSTKVTTFSGVNIDGGLLPIEVLYWDQGGHATFRIEFKLTGTADSTYQPLGENDYALFSSDLVVPPGGELVQASDGSWVIQTGAVFSDMDNAPNEVHGSVAADSIHGGGDDDSLFGGLGADTFVWKLNDGGTAGNPAVDTVGDFTVGIYNGTGNADRLDLADLLKDESSATIDNFLSVEQVSGNTVLHVSSSGGFAGGYSAGAEDQTIVLENVTFDSALSSHDIINQLISNNQLLIDK